MAKRGALYSQLYVGGYNLSGDVNSLDACDSTRQTLTATGLDVGAEERMYGRRDGTLGCTSFFNDAAGASHPVLSAMPTTDVGAMWTLAADGAAAIAAGDIAAAIVAKQASYNANEGSDGSLTFTSQFVGSAYGLEWGEMLTAGAVNQSSGGSLASLDNGAATSFGLQAYLQVLAFTGTSATVTIQESSDDGSGDAWAGVTGGAFAAATAIGTQRIATSNGLTVERYLRVTTSGTFSNFTFAVMIVRNSSAIEF